ncbi:hypothetical protein PGT21_033144 [Puccinia graminis f. sp. tritici]|uniref:Uncharacterized protein n=1 Tax=Puccinia graminis f. sp. tritici TaxID=56615 RepID=A0A5B0P0A2_PUCGR|nr:hypothetical protein PGTUg99_009931 [Puccinia graminis f. sp. tritici]KAA1094941.1 hypothetical protein PGT21_033144 [Puccinia graminis f. sp. tritici]
MPPLSPSPFLWNHNYLGTPTGSTESGARAVSQSYSNGSAQTTTASQSSKILMLLIPPAPSLSQAIGVFFFLACVLDGEFSASWAGMESLLGC